MWPGDGRTEVQLHYGQARLGLHLADLQIMGGGGGGGTDITIGGVPMIVAGGGGGAGYDGTCATGDQPGGNGGGLTGASVTTCSGTLFADGADIVNLSGGGKQIAGGGTGGGFYIQAQKLREVRISGLVEIM